MFYLLINNAQAGPYSLKEVKLFWINGQVNAQTLFWQEGIPDWQPLASIQNLLSESKPLRIIGGFWIRLTAYVLDLLLLALVGFALGHFFSDFFSQIGPWALLVGFTIAILYFSLLNSAIGHGQTLGKRLLGIEVVDRQGHHLSLGRSCLRYVIFALPFYLNCVITSAGLVATSWTALALSVLVFAGGGSIAYLYLFNRRTRQSLHDLAVGSYVTYVKPDSAVDAPPIWRGHLIVTGIFCFFVVGLTTASIALIHNTFFGSLLAVQEAVLSTGNVNSAVVTEGVNWSSFNGNSQTTHVLTVDAHWKGKPADPRAAAHQLAAIVLKQYPDVMKDDLLKITISSGYNLGIFSSSVSNTDSLAPAEWQKQIDSSSQAGH